MQNFLNDFNIFFNMIFGKIVEIYNWLINTVLGEIMLFMIIITIFIGIIYLIIDMRK